MSWRVGGSFDIYLRLFATYVAVWSSVATTSATKASRKFRRGASEPSVKLHRRCNTTAVTAGFPVLAIYFKSA